MFNKNNDAEDKIKITATLQLN